MRTETTPATRILALLQEIYGEDTLGETIPNRILALVEKNKSRIPGGRKEWSQRDTLLITYADTIVSASEPALTTLRRFIESKVGVHFSFIHLLPFFPSTSDHGFSVSDFQKVRPDLGTWEDVGALADNYRVVFDGVINHASASSNFVREFLSGNPSFADFCITRKLFPDTASVVRPRQSPLFHDFTKTDGTSVELWTTFSDDQVDLNYRNPEVLLKMIEILLEYAWRGASMIRLDAIPYLWKEPGTTCIHLPRTHLIIRLIRAVFDAAAPHVLLLSETNVPHEENVSYFGGPERDEAQIVYNFTLAPLLIHTVACGDSTRLSGWARTLESFGDTCTFLNITATHDGIGMRPTEGILDHDERAALLAIATDHGGHVNYKSNSDGSSTPYELNINYFDAINDPRQSSPETSALEIARFLLTQAIAMVLPGIPGIYIHSLLGSRSDKRNVDPADTSTFRSINREQLDASELETMLSDTGSRRAQVLQGLLHLLASRRDQPALHPSSPMEILQSDATIFALRRGPYQNQTLTALFNVSNQITEFPALGVPTIDCIDGERHEAHEPVSLHPYQIRWLVASQ